MKLNKFSYSIILLLPLIRIFEKKCCLNFVVTQTKKGYIIHFLDSWSNNWLHNAIFSTYFTAIYDTMVFQIDDCVFQSSLNFMNLKFQLLVIMSPILGAVHKRCRQLGGEEGSKIDQNCLRIVLKNCRHGGGRCQKSRKIAYVVYGWSLTYKRSANF